MAPEPRITRLVAFGARLLLGRYGAPPHEGVVKRRMFALPWGKSPSIFSILSDMEDDLYRVDDYMEVAFLACGGCRRNFSLDSRDMVAVRCILGDAQDVLHKLKGQ